MIKTIRIISWLLLLTFTTGKAQNPAANFQLDSLPNAGVMLDRGWRFHPGDDLNWAKPDLDDRQWKPIDPTKAIQDVPQIEQAGVSWLRLHITTGQDLPPVLCYMFQSVASDIYLDGRLLYRFGTISANPDSVRAYNPYAAFSLPLQPATQHVLAMRIAYHPGLDYEKIYLGRLPSVVRFNLFPAGEIPAIPLFNIESVYLDSFKVGISFILFILHLSLFIAYRRQRANLYAAGMYLLMGYQSFLRAASDLMHSMDARTILGYSTYASPWISGLMLLIFYSLFSIRKGWPFWLTIGSIILSYNSFPSQYPWLAILISYYLTVELIRVSAVAIRRQLVGARIVMTGVLCHVGLEIVFWITSAYNIPIVGHEWLFHGLYSILFLCIPLTLSLRLALEHGWINKQLSVKLQEVEDLSAQNQAQQQARQELLARQNEELEQQVDERTKELREQAEHLKQLDEAKSRFVTNLTHEFRTPLSLIISPVEKLLESPVLPDTMQTSLQTVDRNARHLLNQVNQLLDISRLENGYMNVTQQSVQVGRLTTQLIDLFSSSAEAKKIALALRIHGDDNLYLMDADKWGKIVYNLLANALKFTPTGGQVDVQLWLEADQARLRVSDTGIGIAADQLPFIFDRFYQADDHITRSFEGTGVGLALVRELTTLLGGRVEVESQPGEGSTFIVYLPVEVAPAFSTLNDTDFHLPVAVQSISNSHATFVDEINVLTDQDDRAFVLIVEDNTDLANFMAGELATRYRVMIANNGQQGWELAQEYLPDVVISDVMMPQMDGFQLTRLIKTNPATDYIAVVLLTARSAHESQIEGLQNGADAYLVKPFDLTELRLKIANLITYQQKLRVYHRQQLTQPDSGVHVAPTEPTDPFLERIYTLLEINLDNPRVGVEWLADQVAMDRKTLYRKLQSKLQLSPTELIRTYRLRRGSELLRSGKTVTETAYSVGFESVTYFGQCFKEVYQMTPTEFINQYT
ncbi:ATP-binding protein [Spirosoma validum]|uniref:histidine kinase n=1 Tax=Spirosoma validum TaxID=2771355 RepID=A0A927AYS6_9BACT|nr:ATP-binding protein [Spirosoma validum]MBD2752345.1 response regulator [Spirosoma validum]